LEHTAQVAQAQQGPWLSHLDGASWLDASVGAGVESFGNGVVQIEGRLKRHDAQLGDGWGVRVDDDCQVTTTASSVSVTGYQQDIQSV
jgi:hypothetical protein